MPETNHFLEAALHYAREWNFSVFPCVPHGKAPLTRTGCLEATTDLGQIETWWTEFPNANVGIATGAGSNLAVVDVDTHKGADSADLFFGGIGEEIFQTVGVETGGGGLQFYYLFPVGVNLRNSANRLGNKIDVRGAGGYVIAPPSVHESGKAYRFTGDEMRLQPFPLPWLVKLGEPVQKDGNVKKNGNGSGSIVSDNVKNDLYVVPQPEFHLPSAIPSGARNDILMRLAASLRYKGLSAEAVDAALQIENIQICQPPLGAAEVRQISRSVARYDAERALLEVSDESVQKWDDVSIARLFVSEHKEKIRFNSDAKKWLVWTGTHWQTDKTDYIRREAQKFSQNLYIQVPALVTSQTDMTTAHRQIRRSNTATGFNAFLDLAKPHLSLNSSELDTNNYLLNCKNGTIDLRTGKIYNHRQSDLITKIISFDYDAAAVCPIFEVFLTTIQPDAEIRSFLQQSIGYSLLGIVRERAFWIMYGAGNNGKSVFINLFSKILADYASSTTSASVMNNKNNTIPNDIARLQGKRFIVIPETEENERLNAALIKQLSGGDKITARFLFAEYFDFYFSGKLWIATNHKPTITDHSKGFWDRLKIIPFSVDIPKEKIIKQDTLLELLLGEASGILNWALRGAAEYFAADSLEVPGVIKNEIEAYKYEQDSIAQFIDEICLIDEDYTADNSALYRRYVEFCKDNGEYARSQRRLTQSLKEKGFEQERGHTSRTWQGLMLK